MFCFLVFFLCGVRKGCDFFVLLVWCLLFVGFCGCGGGGRL
jgi:hypothetical protein